MGRAAVTRRAQGGCGAIRRQNSSPMFWHRIRLPSLSGIRKTPVRGRTPLPGQAPSTLLPVPSALHQILVDGHGAAVLQHEHHISPGYGRSPPLVVDPPLLQDRRYLHGLRGSRLSLPLPVPGLPIRVEEGGSPLSIYLDPDRVGNVQRAELPDCPVPFRLPGPHGSKLRRACLRSGIRDHGSTSTTR